MRGGRSPSIETYFESRVVHEERLVGVMDKSGEVGDALNFEEPTEISEHDKKFSVRTKFRQNKIGKFTKVSGN